VSNLAVVNLKGGVGKTITAVHLAAACHEMEQERARQAGGEAGRVLLVDADPHRSALSWSVKLAALEQSVDGNDSSQGFAFDVIALPVADLHKRLPGLGRAYAHVVIDTPPNDERITRSAAMACSTDHPTDCDQDHIVIPMAPSTMDMDRLEETVKLLVDVEPLHASALHVLITQSRPRTTLATAVRAVLEELGAPTLDAHVPLREAYRKAHGAPPAPQVDYTGVLAEILKVPVAA
jgi:chromosome partitioning protein